MRVSWTRPAPADLDGIQDFIARDRPSAAFKRVDLVIGRTDQLLGDNPLAGQRGRAEATRDLVIAGTPSIVVYRVTDLVEILAVVHAARDWPASFGAVRIGLPLTTAQTDAAPRIAGA